MSHPWRNWISLNQKLVEAKKVGARRRAKLWRQANIEQCRASEKAWHAAHPNGANSPKAPKPKKLTKSEIEYVKRNGFT